MLSAIEMLHDIALYKFNIHIKYVTGNSCTLQPAAVTLLTSAGKSDNIQLTRSIEGLLHELEKGLKKASSATNGVSHLS